MPSKVLHEIAGKDSDFKNPFRSFDHREFICGCGAAFVNIIVSYPIYKMIFRQVKNLNQKFLFLISKFL